MVLEMGWPAIVIWIAALGSIYSSGPALLYLVFISGAFGSLQMLPPGASGGVNVLPQSICAVFFVLKVLAQPGNVSRAAEAILNPRRLGVFTAFIILSLCSSYALPRLYAGRIEVFPVSFQGGTAIVGPVTANITQSGYLGISFLTAVAVSVIGASTGFQRHLPLAILAGALTLLMTGLADLGTYYTGTAGMLEPFRTASYSLLAAAEAVGSKRVVGLTPEASVFGSACVNFLAALLFLRPFFDVRLRRIYVPIIILLLIVMIMLCTSSSAYVGLALLAGIYVLHAIRRARASKPIMREGLAWEFVLVMLAAVGVFAVVLSSPHLLDSTADLLRTMVFEKTASASYAERSNWTKVGLQAFIDSGGLGVGLGTVRTSNWFICIMASTGVYGATLIFGFLVYLFFRSEPSNRAARDSGINEALKLASIPLFTMLALGGTIPDIGILAAAYIGSVTSE